MSASLVTDEADLKKEESTIADLDAKIQKDRSAAFSDEITLNKKTDAYFEALRKGDNKKAAELQKQIKELELKAAAEGAEIRSGAKPEHIRSERKARAWQGACV